MADALRLNIGAPLPLATEGSSILFTNLALTTQNWKLGWIWQIPYADTITHLGFRYGARTTTPPQHTISLQTPDASGFPDGTILGGGSPASATFTPPADTTWDGKFQWVALANSYTTTAGQTLANVIDCTSNPSAGSSSFTRSFERQASYQQALPYYCTNTGSWAKGLGSTYQTPFAAKSSTRVYGMPLQNTSSKTTGTTGNRIALKFTIPAGWCSTYKVLGFRGIQGTATAAGTYKVGVWNAAGTLLQGASKDSDWTRVGASVSDLGEWYFTDALATLIAGTTYYIGFECESSVTVRAKTILCANAGDLLAFPLPGCYSAWNGSSWADTDTEMPLIELILDDITNAAGGGIAKLAGFGGGLAA